MNKKRIIYILTTVTISLLSSCTNKETYIGKLWDDESVVHDNFTDLGNYVIELPEFNDEAILESGIELANDRYDNGDINSIACTAMVTHNDDNEVIVGRNMDVEISQYPAFISKTTFGKYQTVAVTYTASSIATYEEIQEMDSLPDSYVALVPFIATDVFNEEGLYIEINMRSNYSYMSNYGFHSTHGETTRDDGTPWSELRACTMTLPQLVGLNCATVDDALEFIQNSYDWYTLAMPDNPDYDGWNMSFIIGDATGKYGLIEIAQDELSYLPYQNGQGNYYLTPKWTVFDYMGSGYGRLDGVYKIVDGIQTLDQAMDEMKKIMWKNEILWVGETIRADASTNPNPYNQIIFQDDQGNEQLDWRSDYCGEAPVLDDGRLIITSELYENAKTSTYDPKILEYLDDGIEAGTLVVDDGSILFDVNDEKITFAELEEKYEEYYIGLYSEEEDLDQLVPYYEVYAELLNNQSVYWCLDDHNFEALKGRVYAYLHTRYNEDGEYDVNGMSVYEKLKAYYGMDCEKNETYLRDEGIIWTTGLNVGVNCHQKEMKVRFWENDDVVYLVKW